jgi:DNA-binding winged helix-turn-helix (wHTH) protein
MIYAFGRYELNTKNYELRCGSQLCKLEPRGFNVLKYLVEHHGDIVTRDELLNHLWPGQFISEAALTNCIMTARKAIGDSGDGQQVIQTLYGRGYRFVAPVEVRSPDTAPREKSIFSSTPISSTSQIQDDMVPTYPPTSLPHQSGIFQDVLAGEHAFVTVLCGTMDCAKEQAPGLGLEAVVLRCDQICVPIHEQFSR